MKKEEIIIELEKLRIAQNEFIQDFFDHPGKYPVRVVNGKFGEEVMKIMKETIEKQDIKASKTIKEYLQLRNFKNLFYSLKGIHFCPILKTNITNLEQCFYSCAFGHMTECHFPFNKTSPFKTLSCCCGHGKYNPTIIIQSLEANEIFELFSRIQLNTRKGNRFYKKDSQGYYYIPEVIEVAN